MLKSLFIKCLFAFSLLMLISWGRTGHQTTEKIGAAQLMPTARQEVSALNPCLDAALVSDTTICEKVVDGKFLESSQITFLNLGAAYPNQKLSIVIKGKDRSKFPTAPEKAFAGKNVCVTGTIVDYKGRPEIVVTDPKQIEIKD